MRDPHKLAAHRDPHCRKSAAEIAASLTGNYKREHLFVLQQALGLPPVTYMHLPIAVGETGLKLSKSEDAPALSRSSASVQVVAALDFLRQSPPAGLGRAPLGEVWHWARAHWQPRQLAGIKSGQATIVPGAQDRPGSSTP